MSKMTLDLGVADPEWVQLLRAEVAKGRTITAVAADIDMPRPSLSMLLAGNYPAGLDKISAKFAARVVAMFDGQVLCPYLRKGIGAEQCQSHATAPMSMSDPEKLRFWAACRACPQNPTTPKTQTGEPK